MTTPLGDAPTQKFDRCMIDATVKFFGGTIVGGTLSAMFLRWKIWPVVLCSGIGLGIAYSNCEMSMNEFRELRQRRSGQIQLKTDKS